MGNLVKKSLPISPTAITSDKQVDCGFTYMPEELLLAIVEYLALQDFISLITTCKYYDHELLGHSNILWAHICKSLGDISFIIRSIQFGRRWKIDVRTVDLNKPIDLTDKNTLATFNFREIIEEYFLRILHKSSLREHIQEQTNLFQLSELIAVEVTEYDLSKLRNYWTTDISNRKFRKDYFFVVNLGLDPEAVNKQIKLPYIKGGRIIAYQKSHVKPTQRPDAFYNRMYIERQFTEKIKEYNASLQQDQAENKE
jgi:hypothetical protein